MEYRVTDSLITPPPASHASRLGRAALHDNCSLVHKASSQPHCLKAEQDISPLSLSTNFFPSLPPFPLRPLHELANSSHHPSPTFWILPIGRPETKIDSGGPNPCSAEKLFLTAEWLSRTAHSPSHSSRRSRDSSDASLVARVAVVTGMGARLALSPSARPPRSCQIRATTTTTTMTTLTMPRPRP